MIHSVHLYALYAWSGCNPNQVLPPLTEIDAKQKRRLSSLSKLALSARFGLNQQCDLSQVDHILWCSSYGDEHKTLQILQDVSEDQTPSPTAFATSVHNATAGLYSMLYQDDMPSTSLNVGVRDFDQALIYAQALLQSQAAHQVLIIAADEPLPALYQHPELSKPYAMACVLGLPKSDLPANLHWQYLNDTHHHHAERPHALVFADFWQQNAQTLCLGSICLDKNT